jgi:superfamily I DNA/RNA helicase
LPDSFERYAANLVEIRFGKTTRDPEIRARLVKAAAKELREFLIARQVEALSEPQLEKFKLLLDAGATRAELEEFFMTRIPNFQAFLENLIDQFRQGYLGRGS